jgi:hypothetical protein
LEEGVKYLVEQEGGLKYLISGQCRYRAEEWNGVSCKEASVTSEKEEGIEYLIRWTCHCRAGGGSGVSGKEASVTIEQEVDI